MMQKNMFYIHFNMCFLVRNQKSLKDTYRFCTVSVKNGDLKTCECYIKDML